MDRHDRNLAQLQLLLLEMERQLLIISAMIDRLRSRWGLPGGLPVIRLRRHTRYRFRPWPIRAELEKEGQYSRPMPMHHLDDHMAYRNFIQMPPELCQELEQRITAEFQRDRILMRDPVSPGVKHTNLRHKIDDGSIGFPDSESLRIGGPKVNFFILRDDTFPNQALANEALLQPHYGLERDGLQL